MSERRRWLKRLWWAVVWLVWLYATTEHMNGKIWEIQREKPKSNTEEQCKEKGYGKQAGGDSSENRVECHNNVQWSGPDINKQALGKTTWRWYDKCVALVVRIIISRQIWRPAWEHDQSWKRKWKRSFETMSWTWHGAKWRKGQHVCTIDVSVVGWWFWRLRLNAFMFHQKAHVEAKIEDRVC